MIHDNPIAGSASPSIAKPPAQRHFPVTGLIVTALLLAAIAGGWMLLQARSHAAASAAAAAASAMANRIVPVTTAQVARRDVPVWLEGLGNVSAFYTVTVKTQVDGRIDKVLFKEGQHVKKGDVLVQIDPRPFAIQLESAQAALLRDTANTKNARVNAERYKTLSEQNLIAVQQYTDQQATVDQLDAQIRSDQAQIDSARLNLDYAAIKSPIDGVTGVRLVDPGNVVHASDTTGLIVVTQLDPIALFFTLPEDDLAYVIDAMRTAGGGLVVEAISRDGDTKLGEGKLAVIDNQINQATATIRLKAIFDNPKQALWPNQFVKARLHVSTRTNAIVVPVVAVQHGPQGTFTYVVGPDSVVAVRPVTVDATQGETAIVSNGLEAGEQVVVEGQAQLRPNARVSARPATGAPSGASGPNGTAGEPASGPPDSKERRP
jgi:multidrug efflux system membrane fusion protein